nr:hypothetical protein BaRGS_016281 [Batillaria attramentaria]
MTTGLANDTLLIASSDDLKNFLFLYFIFVMGAILRHLAFLTKLAIPYTVLVFALGMVAGALIPLSANLLIIGPHTQLNIFMPILIFEGAFAMDVYVFRKVFWQALLLAGPGLAFMIGMTATVAKLLLNWDWYWSLLFGAIVSATDPVAVVALLKEIGASQHLSLLIEGESLLNDGTAMVAFYAVYQIMTSTTITGVFGIVKLLVRFAVGGPLFGYFVAYVSLFWLSRTFNDPLSEIAVTILAAYLTFFAAETMLGVSGVLALCVLGIVLSNNRTSISPEVEEFLHSFWEALSYLANTLIFFLVGMTIVQSASMKTALSYIADAKMKTTSVWKTDRFLASVDWDFVDQQCAVKDPFQEEMTKEEQEAEIDMTERVWAQCPNCASCPLKVLTNRWVVTTVALVLYLLVDAPLTTASLAIETKLVEYVNLEAIMIVDTIILILMASYFIARTVVLKQVYVRTPWFWLSIAIIVHGVIDDIVLMTVPSDHLQTPHDGQYTTTEYIRIVSICFRFIRQLHALEAFMPLLIMLLDKSLSKHLSNGYDVGRGFVLGEEEVRNVIELMSDRKEIVDELRNHCDNAKFEILKCLGLLQKKHPEVAMGVKTHRAIRSVLNQLRMGIHTLQQEGVLEEAEGSELQTIIESRMKKLLTAPPKVPLASVEKILRNIPWISDNDKLVQFIKGRARLVNYEYGQEMMKQGDPTTGMSIILSGLVKLELSAPIVGGPGYATRILDFLTSGNVLGEMGVLTGNPRSASVKCETAVQVLELSLKDIQEAFVVFSNIDPPLKIRLWRLGAVRLATGVVMDKPAFQSMTKEQVRMLLECGSVHEIVVEKEGTHFLVNSVTMEVVLLYGLA